MDKKLYEKIDDSHNSIVINTVPYHPTDLMTFPDTIDISSGQQHTQQQQHHNKYSENTEDKLRLPDSQLPVHYMYSAGVGIPPNPVPGGLLQGAGLNPYTTQSRMYGSSSFSGGVEMDPMNGTHLSGMMSQPPLLHLHHLQDNSMDIQRAPGNMIDTVPLPHSKMLLSQPGMLAHTQRPIDHSGDPSRLPYSQPIVPSGNQNLANKQQSRWAGPNVRKPWHSDAHQTARKEMNEKIIELLQQRRPNATSDWQQKLPQMAKRLEEALYSEAPSFEQYSDKSTLKVRLQQLASSMGSKIGPSKISGPGNGPTNGSIQPPPTHGLLHGQMQQSNQLQSHHGPVLTHSQHPSQGMNMIPPHNMRLGNNSAPNMNGHGPMRQGQNPLFPQSSNGQSLYHPQSSQMAPIPNTRLDGPNSQSMQSNYPMSNRQFINLTQINPIYNLPPSQENSGSLNLPTSEGSRQLSGYSQNDSSYDTKPPSTSNGSLNSGNSNDGQRKNPGHPGNSSHSEEHRKQVLKQQQQRLLLLRHASKCPHEGDRCPVTPHCAAMKQLWAHIMGCKDQECQVAHCVSSRYVLSHYSKCKENNCPVCGPVREVINKNVNKNKEIVTSVSAPSRAEGANPTKVALAAPGSHSTDNVSCAMYSFTDQQIRAHIAHLQDGLRMKSSDVKEICFPLVEDILKHQNGYIFSCPVDPVSLGIPDYLTIIKVPMDIGTVKKRLESGYYRDVHEAASDVRLCFDNAMLYNPSHTEVHKVAKSFKTTFDRELKKKLDAVEREIETKRLNPDNCSLCGEHEIMYEPPNIYCNGRCTSQRIRRNSYYYVGGGAYHWCQPCFNELKDPIRLINDGVLYKKDLQKKKHIEEHKEPWVCCDTCERWVHQICTLFNGRRNLSVEMPFTCPLCVLEQRKKRPDHVLIPEKKTQAVDLPHTLMSEFLEQRVNECLERAYQQQATKLNKPIDEIEKAPPLCVRQVSSVDHPQRVREGMLERYKHKNYPTEFPCRTKCVLLFQNLDGQDVILFGMYVYEYGHKAPQPNQRRVYVSYLDSVHYFRPRQYRTPVYHEIIISYLEYVKRRGFHTAHIWACPPMKGDDYIFNCHPQDQKTPKDDRLRLWYVSVLEKSKDRGIVHEVVDFHTEFMADPMNDCTVMPYFDGDYWVGEAENIIRNLKSGDVSLDDLDSGGSEDDDGCTRSKRKAKKKSKSKRNVRPRLTRGTSSRPERDVVMAKLSSIIEPMKEAFFVARLYPKEFAIECANLRAAELAAEANNGLTNPDEERLREEALTSVESNPNTADVGNPTPQDVSTTQEVAESKLDTSSQSDTSIAIPPVKRQSSLSNMSPRPNSSVENTIRDDTEDGDDTQENEHFETRLAFLNLCQGNHYQFDQLRRAKYTSLMTLYHLHNPDAPKFSIVCEACSVTILTGHRYNCETCEVDYCQNCYTQNPKIHAHPLRPIVVSAGQPAMQLTEEQRRERQRSITLHLQLLEHSSTCDGIDCKSKNCQKMKEFLRHGKTCTDGLKKGCPICKRVLNLLNLHARNCKKSTCDIPKCREIKEHIRKNAMKQQQMDDRRRQMMNDMYRGNQGGGTAS